eukprot:1191802-Heterocapsa_arctica.AAC.1
MSAYLVDNLEAPASAPARPLEGKLHVRPNSSVLADLLNQPVQDLQRADGVASLLLNALYTWLTTVLQVEVLPGAPWGT